MERIVIFGATGDLAARYLMPALAKLYEADKLPPGIKITGVDRQEWDDEHGFRRLVLDNLEHHAGNVSADARATMAVEVLEYRQADVTDAESVISALEPLTQPIVAYLALPLAVFAPTLEALKKANLPEGSQVAIEKHLGGAELHVAVGLSRLGHRAGWAGRLGDDEFGKEILAFTRGEGVDVSRASFDSEAPTGLYFKEWRALGQLRVYYYRAGSAASRMRFDELDLEYLLSGEILHLTGIAAALSESCHDLIERLLTAANERGVTVSFDVNVRRLLFEGRDPRKILGPLAARADLLFLSDDEAELLFGGSDPGSLQETRRDIRAETVVVHRAEGAFAVEGGGVSERAAYPVDAVDTVGAGDAFVAGFLSGRLRGWSTEECLDMANACGACAVTVPGDLKGLPTAEGALALRRGRPGVER